MTYSIVARDPGSGALGIGVQSHFFNIGAVVPWVRPGVGATAVQAFADPAYGLRCLDALASGLPAAEALNQAAADDEAPYLRQVGVVSADGSVAAVTGAGCIDYAGHLTGEGFTVQANMMASQSVWPAMADAYLSASGPLPRRLLAALRAAQAAGGDARGVMSGALVVAGGGPDGGPAVDLRVAHSRDPIGDLAWLLDASEAYGLFNRATGDLFGGNAEAALAHVEAGLGILPGDENLQFVRAAALLARGDFDGGRQALRALLASRPSLEVIVKSFAAKGLLRLPASTSVETLIGP